MLLRVKEMEEIFLQEKGKESRGCCDHDVCGYVHILQYKCSREVFFRCSDQAENGNRRMSWLSGSGNPKNTDGRGRWSLLPRNES